jgi:hypothetical protein
MKIEKQIDSSAKDEAHTDDIDADEEMECSAVHRAASNLPLKA